MTSATLRRPVPAIVEGGGPTPHEEHSPPSARPAAGGQRLANRRGALAGERVTSYEAILRRADGRDLFVSISAAPVEGTGLAITILRDISAARRLDKARDEFLETAAHELKTPLAVIRAYAQLLEKRAPADGQQLAAIERQVDRLDGLVQHLLDTSRLHVEVEGRREQLDLGALAREVVDRARRGAPRHTFTVEAPGLAPVVVDRPRLARVVAVLVDNAVRFSPAGGPVAVQVDARAGEAIPRFRAEAATEAHRVFASEFDKFKAEAMTAAREGAREAVRDSVEPVQREVATMKAVDVGRQRRAAKGQE